MSYKKYQLNRSNILKLINDFRISDYEGLQLKFDLISAGLKNYLPEISYTEHIRIFKEILLNQKLTFIEQSFFNLISTCALVNYSTEMERLLRSSPCIICTYHTGSYRLINHFLVKKDISFALVIAKSIKIKSETEFFDLHKKMTVDQHLNKFEIIDAEDATSGLKMLRALKMGRSLLLYIDGNTGSSKSDKNLCNIDFLNQKLYVRKGIAQLSYTANVPILPVLCHRADIDNISLCFEKVIIPDKCQSKEEYTISVTIQLYKILEDYLRVNAGQWEGWIYIHKTAHIVNLPSSDYPNRTSDIFDTNKRLKFNHDDYSLISDSGRFYLFQKSGYRFFLISKEMFTELNDFKIGAREVLKPDSVASVIFNKNVLIEQL